MFNYEITPVVILIVAYICVALSGMGCIRAIKSPSEKRYRLMTLRDRAACWLCVFPVQLGLYVATRCFDSCFDSREPISIVLMAVTMAVGLVASFRLFRRAPFLFERLFAGVLCLLWLAFILAAFCIKEIQQYTHETGPLAFCLILAYLCLALAGTSCIQVIKNPSKKKNRMMTLRDHAACWLCVFPIQLWLYLATPCFDSHAPFQFVLMEATMAVGLVASFRLFRLAPFLFERLFAGMLCLLWLGDILVDTIFTLY